MSAIPRFIPADAALSRIDAAIEAERDDGARLEPLPLRDALARAERLLNPQERSGTDDYPIDALGPLAGAARALADGVQVAPAMAGQSVLSAAALLVQSVANVRSLDGAVKPLSMFALTVALSGDGKDSADRVALRSVHEFQRAAARLHGAQAAEHERAQAERKRSDPMPEPPPPAPYRIAADVTIEGLRRSFVEGVASQGAFSTEAGVILAGHAMSPEHRTKTAATLCGLWDRGHLSVVRGGAGRVERYGVRLSSHLLVQPAGLGDALNDEGLSNIGFWPRFMLAWPAPLAPRVYRPWRPEASPPIRDYWRRCDELLGRPVPADCDALPQIEIGSDALGGLAPFFERMEREGRRGSLRDVRPFALRATEHVCRVAGVLTAFSGGTVIDRAQASAAGELVAHSLESWQQALGGKADPVPGWALTLYRWLAARPEGVALRDIPRIGPAPIRPAARRDAAAERLRSLGLIDDSAGRAVAVGVDHATG